MKAKEAMDLIFKDVKFDAELLKRLVRNNIQFTTDNAEVRDLIGSKLLGCFHLSYTQFHKAIFYDDVFGINYTDVVDGMKKITTIPKHFKVAMDDVNMVCFYMAHRFATAKDLSKDQRQSGVEESFNYFGYRTLVLLNAHYWKYPISKPKAVTLSESLSGNYLITRMKNWNEYVHYRSEEYLKSRLMKSVAEFKNDRELPNNINDLYNRYKDMIKNIYREFLNIDENDQLRSSKSVVNDADGQAVLMDRLNDPRSYVDKVLNTFVAKDMFIQQPLVDVLNTPVVSNLTQDEMNECLVLVFDYYQASVKSNKEVGEFITAFLVDSISYLKSKRMELNARTNIIEVISMITGNLLRSRGTDITITEIKAQGEVLLKKVYKKGKVRITDRNLTKIRNGFCIYILMLALL